MPDNQSAEKMATIRALGAELVLVPPAPFANPGHFVHTSRRIAEETDNAIWANQFDNIANRKAHIFGTAEEIWEQMDGRIDGFTCAAGTGGTIAGTGLGLKAKNADITVALTDPQEVNRHLELGWKLIDKHVTASADPQRRDETLLFTLAWQSDDPPVRPTDAAAPIFSTVDRIHERGGKVIAGTDSPILPYGLSLILEIEQLSEAGLGPMAAIEAATRVAAEALGASDDLGTIEPGKIADLVLLGSDPSADIRNLRKTEMVVANGRLLTLEQLLKPR